MAWNVNCEKVVNKHIISTANGQQTFDDQSTQQMDKANLMTSQSASQINNTYLMISPDMSEPSGQIIAMNRMVSIEMMMNKQMALNSENYQIISWYAQRLHSGLINRERIVNRRPSGLP